MASLGTKLERLGSSKPVHSPSFDITLSHRPAPAAGRAFNRRQWLFVTADLCSISSGALIAIVWRFLYAKHHILPTATLAEHFSIAILYAALIALICHTQGLYSIYQPISRYREVIAILKSIFVATFLLGGSLFVSGIKTTSRLVIGFTAVYSLLSMIAWREFRRWSLGKGVADGLSCHNVIIVGTDPTAISLAHHLSRHRQLGFVVLGHLGAIPSVTPDPQTQLVAPPKILGTPSDLKHLCRAHFADEVIICSQHRPTVLQAIADARECGLGVRVIPDLYDGVAFGAHLHYLGDFPSMAVAHRAVPTIALKFKRAIDVFVSAAALLLLSPILLVLAIVVKVSSPGPVLYASNRIGRKGRSFTCFKFRTMVADADVKLTDLHHLNERDGILFKITNDPRITPVGRFMRKYSLDELPQFVNVFLGDMSLVGPRPPLAKEVKQYQLEYLRRLEAAPGITGLWQVEARNHPSFDRYISLDLQYVENWSLALDFYILLRTVRVVFAGTGS